MPRDWRFFIENMAEFASTVRQFSSGVTREQFFSDRLRHDAVLRNLELIGEAAKHVPEPIREQMPGIPWKKLCGMRDMLAHQYFSVNRDLIWDTVSVKVPELQIELALFVETHGLWDEDDPQSLH